MCIFLKSKIWHLAPGKSRLAGNNGCLSLTEICISATQGWRRPGVYLSSSLQGRKVPTHPRHTGVLTLEFPPSCHRALKVGLQELSLPCSATSWEHGALRSNSGVLWHWACSDVLPGVYALTTVGPLHPRVSHSRFNQPRIKNIRRKLHCCWCGLW